jgi:hypothetical protein
VGASRGNLFPFFAESVERCRHFGAHAEQERGLIAEGRRLIAEGRRLIAEGRRLIAEGRFQIVDWRAVQF